MDSDKKFAKQLSSSVSMDNFLKLKRVYGYRSEPGVFSKIIDLSQTGFHKTKKIVYLVGNSVVILDSENDSQTIIKSTEGSLFISYVTISKSGRFIAIAEETTEVGIITIYEFKEGKDIKIKKRKTLLSKECNSYGYSQLIFLPDNERHLISVTKESPFKFLLWDWERSRIKEITEINGISKVNGIFFTPNDKNLLYIYGNQQSKNFPIRTFIVRPDNDTVTVIQKFELIKSFIKNHDKNIVCHLNISDYYTLIGTRKGELLLLNKMNEIKLRIDEPSLDTTNYFTVSPFRDGFAVADENFNISLYVKNGKDIKYPFVKCKKVINNIDYTESNILSIVGFNSRDLLIGTTQGELLHLTENQETTPDGYDFTIKPFYQQNHVGTIIDILIVLSSPAVAIKGFFLQTEISIIVPT